jgi:opacity protein-like surface antigen
MKKLLVVAAALLLPAAALASDIAAGALELNGSANLAFSSSSTKVDGTLVQESRDLGGTVSGLYYLSPMLGVGLELQLLSSSSTAKPSGNKSELTAYAIGPRLGLDLGVAPSLSVYGDLALVLIQSNSTYTPASGASSTSKDGGFGLRVGAGIKYFLSRSASLNAGLAYQLDKRQDDGSPKVKTDTSSIQLLVGLSIYLNNPGGAAH